MTDKPIPPPPSKGRKQQRTSQGFIVRWRRANKQARDEDQAVRDARNAQPPGKHYRGES